MISVSPFDTIHFPKTYFCGPGVLAKSIKEATVHHSGSTVEFSFAKVGFFSIPSHIPHSYYLFYRSISDTFHLFFLWLFDVHTIPFSCQVMDKSGNSYLSYVSCCPSHNVHN